MTSNDKIYYREGIPVPETPAAENSPDFWKKTDIVGKGLPRVDAYDRVSGTALFPSDILLPNMIYGVILRSPHPHARVKKIDISEARKMKGVRAIITGDSAEAKGITWQYRDQQVPLFDPHCRFEGEVVAAVAADSWYQASDAARAIKVDYEILAFVADYEKALDEGAAQVQDKGNLLNEETYARGDLKKGLTQADLVLEETYHTPCELHTPLELHGCVANWERDRLTIWESSQGVYAVQAKIAQALSLPLSKIRVKGHYMGGGFGSKLSPGKYTVICSLLAKKTGRPVKLLLSREETYLCVGNRPANTMRLKAGIKKDGTLTALEFECSGPSGAYPAGGAQMVDWLARDLYQCDHVRTSSKDVLINAGPARPFRAPGHPQGAWALEQMIDSLAAEIGMDPVELRLKNIPLRSQARPGNPPYTTTGLRQCLEEGAKEFKWQATLKEIRNHNRKEGHRKRGIGVGACLWIAGGGGPPSTVILKMYKDGSVNLNMGASDLGTGTKTIMAQVAAEELGIHPHVIQIEHADTATTQFATPSGGSKTVPTEAPTVRNAAISLKRALLAMAAEDLEVGMEELVYVGDEIVWSKDRTKKIKITDVSRLNRRGEVIGVGYRGPNPADKVVNPFAAQFCEVEVNTLTGEIEIRRFLGAHDSGRVMNRLTFDNQVYGGIVMGIGLGLTECRQLDESQTGKLCNKNWHDYKLPTALDVPQTMTTLAVELGDQECNNTGAKGLGEPVTIPTAAALANALYMATGVRFTRAPISPMAVIAELSKKKKG
ncbi:MAG: xanthine dehydrogenase family protein molybdopterin-binding subunit [Desulfurivibrionaceae bacterium]|nr:xanthine dehydrogenase family protein molybdopterin-binding subunit [Desulfurivibrionaceae bacterium]